MRALLILAVLFCRTASAFELTALGGFNFAAPTYSLTSTVQTTSSSGAIVFGLLGAIPLPQSFEFESGAIFQNIKFTSQSGTAETVFRFQELNVPFLLRYWIDDRVAFGAGPYWGIGTGAVNVNGSSNTFSDLNLYSNDFGLVFNIRAKTSIYQALSAVIDGRYLLGLQERAKDVSLMSYKTRSIAILAGISFEF